MAAHSVRAVPSSWLERIAAYAEERGIVRHVHASEQRLEVDACRAEHGCSPIALLARTGFLGPRTSVVHGIHVDDQDVSLMASTRTMVITCPTTEGNLGDGHFPALAYRDAGVRIAIGSDSQVRVDPFEEVRELETGARRQVETPRGAALRLRRPVGRAGRERRRQPRPRRGGPAVDRARPHPPNASRRARRGPFRSRSPPAQRRTPWRDPCPQSDSERRSQRAPGTEQKPKDQERG